MKPLFFLSAVAVAVSFASCSVGAAEAFDYTKVKGTDSATYNALNQETTRLNTYTYGNSVAIQALSADQVRQDNEFKADQKRQDDFITKDQARQDAATKGLQGRVDTVTTTTVGNTQAIGNLSNRADDTDLALIGQNTRNNQQDTRLNGHDQQFANQDLINEALSSKVNGMYVDTAGLRSETRQAQRDASRARREAKQANHGAVNAMAIAGQQFDIHGGFQTAVSAGFMNGYQSLAIGAGGALSDRIFLNAAFATSGSVTGGVVSSTYSW